MSKYSCLRKEAIQSDHLQLALNLQRQQSIRSDRLTVRTVTLYHSLPGECLPVPSVEEVAKKKGVKMAQIAIAWSLKRVTAPIFGTTKLQNPKETIGEQTSHMKYHRVLTKTAEGLDIELTEEVKYLEEPYLSNAVLGHAQ
jgi:diketogulonate reductase-like aldo/keto reductase